MVAAYQHTHPAVPADELVACVRVGIIYTATSSYPLGEPLLNRGPSPPRFRPTPTHASAPRS
ncbi:hypothetical protein GCM10023317_27910 [Actinopolymorpha pittospori]